MSDDSKPMEFVETLDPAELERLQRELAERRAREPARIAEIEAVLAETQTVVRLERELAAAKARIKQLENGYDEFRTLCNRMKAQRDALAAELEAARRDAERYRRLAGNVEFGSWSVTHVTDLDTGADVDILMDDKTDMDARLDAEMDIPPAPSSGHDGGAMSVIEEIAAERQRQIGVEGWTPEHDDEHPRGDLALASVCYALNASGELWALKPHETPRYWPWHAKSWKPKDRRHDLIRAAALLVAEIERLDRKEAR